ncbi:MAG: cyclic nucleotide-binding domain-containing protein [Fimbriimonadaceae bacterium]
MEHFDVFKKNYLVAGLPDEATAEIAGLAEYRVFPARDIILERGARGADLFVILDGKVQILNPNGERLGEAGPGSVIGEVALVDDGPRSADVVCVTTVKAARLPGPVLRKYMFDHKENGFVMLANLSRVLSMRLRGANIHMDDLAGKAQDPWRLAL